eukprot:gene45113-9758_t
MLRSESAKMLKNREEQLQQKEQELLQQRAALDKERLRRHGVFASPGWKREKEQTDSSTSMMYSPAQRQRGITAARAHSPAGIVQRQRGGTAARPSPLGRGASRTPTGTHPSSTKLPPSQGRPAIWLKTPENEVELEEDDGPFLRETDNGADGDFSPRVPADAFAHPQRGVPPSPSRAGTGDEGGRGRRMRAGTGSSGGTPTGVVPSPLKPVTDASWGQGADSSCGSMGLL